MNKRKVLSIFLLALITVALAVSCSSNIDTPATNTEELAYVTFGNGHSRELGTSYETLPYNSLYWFYTAQKTDSYGTTGQVGLGEDDKPTEAVSKGTNREPAPGLSGRVGPFSQGAWKFTLYAYKEASKSTLVYKSEAVHVILKGNEVKSVPVSVTTQGSTGTLEVKDAYFEWYNNQDPSLGTIGQGGGDAKPLIKFSLVNSNGEDVASSITTPITFLAKDNTGKLFIANNTYIYTVPVGYYTGIVSVYLKQDATTENGNIAIDNEGTPVYTQSFGVRIYGNATTYISGNMVEGVNSKVTFDVPEQEMVVFTVLEDGSKSLTVPVSPKGATTEGETEETTTKKTIVSFPAGALDTTSVHQLDVKVTPTASAEQKFQVSGITQTDGVSRTAVAGIDLTMVKYQKNNDGTTEPIDIDSFNGQAVTITTYIATGLSGVEVKYLNGNNLDHIAGPIENTTGTPSYDPATGKLIFSTTHFSEYVVVSPVEAINVNTGVPYTSLATAIADAKDGQEVKVMKGIVFDSRISIDSKNITLNLNGNTLTTGNSDPRFFNILNNSNVVITGNGRLTGLTESNAVQHNQNSLIKVEKSILTIENGTFTAGGANGNGLYGIFVAEGGNLILGTTDNGPTITTYFAAVSSNNTTSPANIVVNSGTYECTSSDNKAGSSATNRDKECAAFYLPASGNYEFNGGTLIGSKYAISTPYYNVNLKISINGGTFKGGVSSIFKGTETGSGSSTTDERVITITGGRFSSNPSSYLATGCQFGYRDGYYEILPEGPAIYGNTLTVTPENAQYTLDGAYGSINDMTIIFSAGEYPRLELGRATKYTGSNTDYYIGGISVENKKTFDEFYSIKNSGQWSASAYYVRNIKNLTIKAEEGTTVKIDGLIASSGHVYGQVYDYVLDKAYTSGSAYYLSQNLNNITFENIEFKSQVNIATSSENTLIDGVTFKNCKFDMDSTASGNQALRYYNESNNGNVKNLTVDSCLFEKCYQGVYTQKINGITVKNSTFDTTGHNAIAVQSGSEAIDHKVVIITDNTFVNIGDRIIRFGDVGADTQITIKNNSATNSGDSKGEVIKAQSLAEGITYNISGNNWGEGKTVANIEFQDSTQSQN